MNNIGVYELTPLLNTISTVSATIVAVVSGFVMSRVIDISSKRKTLEQQLKKLQQERDNIHKEREYKWRALQETTFLDFLKYHSDKLLNEVSFRDIDLEERDCYMNNQLMELYWNKAIDMVKSIKADRSVLHEVDENSVPKAYKDKLAYPSLEYWICSIIVRCVESKCSDYGIFADPCYEVKPFEYYDTDYAKIKELQDKEMNLMQDTNLVLCQLPSIINTKETCATLLFIILVTMFGVIYPLFNIPSSTADYNVFEEQRLKYIMLFVGLMFGFVGYLYFMISQSKKAE